MQLKMNSRKTESYRCNASESHKKWTSFWHRNILHSSNYKWVCICDQWWAGQCNETCWFGIWAEISSKNYIDKLDRILDVNFANKIVRTYSFIIFIGIIVFHGFQPVGIARHIRDPMKDLCETRMKRKKKWNKTPTTTSFLIHFACTHLFNILIAADVKCTINYLLLNLKCPPSPLRWLFCLFR